MKGVRRDCICPLSFESQLCNFSLAIPASIFGDWQAQLTTQESGGSHPPLALHPIHQLPLLQFHAPRKLARQFQTVRYHNQQRIQLAIQFHQQLAD